MTLIFKSMMGDRASASSKQDHGFLRTVVIFATAAALGAFGWSGRSSLNCLALLYPFVYLQSQRRLDTLSAASYYAGATWSVIPASRDFFATGANPTKPFLMWLALVLLSSLPWFVLYSSRFLPLSAVGALILTALPPLGLVTVAHPIIAAGSWFPGTRWFGVGLPLVLLSSYRRLGTVVCLAVLSAASVIDHIRFHRPTQAVDIVAINTRFGHTTADRFGLDSQARELALQQIVLAHPNTLVLLPESVLPGWSAIHEARWVGTFAQLKKQHTGLLLGTTLPIPNTDANRNILLSRGYTEHLSYVQRIPVPMGMWHLGTKQSGYPLMLDFPPTIRVWNRRAGVLICYEQLLVWPALQSLGRNPDMLLAPSNLYWAARTPIPAIQHVAAQDWADLWDIPLYEASNR